MKDIKQQYKEATAAFHRRPNQHNHEAIAQLYDLKAALQRQPENRETAEMLSAVCSLLELHLSALRAFEPFADAANRKDQIKLFKLRDNASYKQDKFALKDIRTLRRRIATVQPRMDNFITADNGASYHLNCAVTVFNKTVCGSEVEIFIHADEPATPYLARVAEMVRRLADYPAEKLMAAYNDSPCLALAQSFDAYRDKQADEDWFDALEVYSLVFDCGGGRIVTTVTAGDVYLGDAYLMVEFADETLQTVTIDYDET